MGLYHDTCHHHIYRLTCAEFDALWERSGGNCEICGQPESETKAGRLFIDHNGYSQHLVRGLLCARCNAAMRRVDEGRREYMSERTARYLEREFRPLGTPVPPPVGLKSTRAYRARTVVEEHVTDDDRAKADELVRSEK